MTLTNFAGAVAVVTGGASGIGLATGRALHARGAHVVLADINRAGLQQAEAQIGSADPTTINRVLGVPTDVTDEAQVRSLMRRASEMFGHIDLVVTCAGIGRGGRIDEFPASEMQALMNSNFMGTYHCVQAALPAMRQQRSGHFVLLASVAGKLGAPLLSGYCATKWAVRGFSSAIRAELFGTGIGITTVYPAWVDTPMIHQEMEGMNLLNIQALLTAEQVAEEILGAVAADQRDLTLAPNPDIAAVLQVIKENQDQAEDLMGMAFQQQLGEYHDVLQTGT